MDTSPLRHSFKTLYDEACIFCPCGSPRGLLPFFCIHAESVTALLEQWIRVWNESPGSEKAYAQYLALLQQHAVPRSDASTERFIRLATTICVESCVESRTIDGGLEVDGEAAGGEEADMAAVVACMSEEAAQAATKTEVEA